MLKKRRRSVRYISSADEIVAPLLELRVLALGDVVDADVNFRAAGHPAGQLFAQEKIRDAGAVVRRLRSSRGR